MYPQPDQHQTATDEHLAALTCQGSASAFETLVYRYQVRLMAYLTRRLNVHDAEDVVQDTFVQAYQNMAKYDNRWRFSTWIFTIAGRLAISRMRKNRNHAELTETASNHDGPIEHAAKNERQTHLWAVAKRELTEDAYNALWLFYVEEQSTAEIAQVLGKSWVNIKTMLHRARKKLEPHLVGFAGIRDRSALLAIQSEAGET